MVGMVLVEGHDKWSSGRAVGRRGEGRPVAVGGDQSRDTPKKLFATRKVKRRTEQVSEPTATPILLGSRRAEQCRNS